MRFSNHNFHSRGQMASCWLCLYSIYMKFIRLLAFVSHGGEEVYRIRLDLVLSTILLLYPHQFGHFQL